MQTFHTFTLLYSTLLVYPRLRIWNKMPKPQKEETECLSIYERQKLQRFSTQCGAAFGSVRSLVKASSLPVSTVIQFLHSNPSYTKVTPAARKFGELKAFARFKNEIWFMDLAYVDKLAKNNNGVKYLLVRQDLFDRTMDTERNWNKRFHGNGSCIFDNDYKKESTTKK